MHPNVHGSTIYNNPDMGGICVHQKMSTLRMCGIYIIEYYSAMKN